MDFVTWARSPWGEDILTHISWSLFWASLVGGILFLVAHGGYMLFSLSLIHISEPTRPY